MPLTWSAPWRSRSRTKGGTDGHCQRAGTLDDVGRHQWRHFVAGMLELEGRPAGIFFGGPFMLPPDAPYRWDGVGGRVRGRMLRRDQVRAEALRR